MPVLDYLVDLLGGGPDWLWAALHAACAMIIFVIAKRLAPMVIVYRRNNPAAAFLLVLAMGVLYVHAYAALLAFFAGLVAGAWTWAVSFRAANRSMQTSSSRQMEAALVDRDTPHERQANGRRSSSEAADSG